MTQLTEHGRDREHLEAGATFRIEPFNGHHQGHARHLDEICERFTSSHGTTRATVGNRHELEHQSVADLAATTHVEFLEEFVSSGGSTSSPTLRVAVWSEVRSVLRMSSSSAVGVFFGG